jgi:uncharacterized protein YlxW (UPF0749 family)
MLKTKCFIVGGMILSSSLRATTSSPVKTQEPTLEELELCEKWLEERERKQKFREIEREGDLEWELKKQNNEINELKRKVETLNNRLDSIERDKILNAPLPKLHPPVLFR